MLLCKSPECRPIGSSARSRAGRHRFGTLFAMTSGTSNSSQGYDQALQLLRAHKGRAPQCLVLDLDYTIWPFWCEMYTVHDTPRLYPEAEGIIDACRQEGILVAAASRTPTPDVARAFLTKTGLDVKFDNVQLIPARDGYDAHSAQKDTCHLPNFKAATRHAVLSFARCSGWVSAAYRFPQEQGYACRRFGKAWTTMLPSTADTASADQLRR